MESARCRASGRKIFWYMSRTRRGGGEDQQRIRRRHDGGEDDDEDETREQVGQQSGRHGGERRLGVGKGRVEDTGGHPREHRPQVEHDDAADGDRPRLPDLALVAGREKARQKLRGTEERESHAHETGRARDPQRGESEPAAEPQEVGAGCLQPLEHGEGFGGAEPVHERAPAPDRADADEGEHEQAGEHEHALGEVRVRHRLEPAHDGIEEDHREPEVDARVVAGAEERVERLARRRELRPDVEGDHREDE